VNNIDTLCYKTKGIIQKYGFSFKKNFGQNFLIDERVLQKIINSADINKNDTIIEIGPGIGTLTAELAKKARKVLAVQIDNTLIPILNDTLSEYNNIEIINADIMKFDIESVIQKYENVKLTANLPYYITTPIIMNILEKGLDIKNITVMIQKEVAQRIQAKPSSKDYGSLSLIIQYYCTPHIAANVPRNCFIPRPNVDSAVISLIPHIKPPVDIKNTDMFFKFIKAAFSMRRKTLVNCISSSEDLKLNKQQSIALITASGYDEKIRGENLTLYDFAKIYDAYANFL